MPVNRIKKNNLLPFVYAITGCTLFAIGLNVFITPLGLYNGGFLGIAQLLRTLVVAITGMSPGQVDIAGVLYFLLNLPLIYFAWKKLGKDFLTRTIIAIIIQSLVLTIVPVPSESFITDYLTACIIGGMIAGLGSGLVLRGGSSAGGQDILGLYFIKKIPNFSVGKLALIINFFVYGVCFFLFDIEIVIYSLIYGVVFSITCDRVHIQNINVSMMIFTKKLGISKAIMAQTGRGVTNWDGEGAYTNKTSYILFVVISKYEMNQMKQIVRGIDPEAFVVFTEGCSVSGNFEKRLIT